MPELNFVQELMKAAVAGLLPTAALILGGRYFLDRYDLRKKKLENELELERKQREQSLELARFVRQQQYEALQELYSLFSEFVRLYRIINSGHVDLQSETVRHDLLKEIASAEGHVDAAILRVASEFTHHNSDQLARYLADLRQAVQLWRESVREGNELPFYSSGQLDYMRFKQSFVSTCTYLASVIYQRIEPVVVDEAVSLLTEVFDNRHERHGPYTAAHHS
jgi:hypothetical protein